MANISKMNRDRMLAFLEELKHQHADDAFIRALNEIENHLREKKYGLVWEEHSEEVDELLAENIPVLTADPDRRLCKDESLPWNFIIEGDNLQALYLLEKTHHGRVDCIYIDPPYNSGATDWKYNNNYVGKEDEYRHSKWLSMMRNRLLLAKRLLNPKDSVLIVTIDEREFLHLGCLLEELFPTAKIQMVSSVINHASVAKFNEFNRNNEYIFFVMLGEFVLQSIDNSKTSTAGVEVSWNTLRRHSPSNIRTSRPRQFYPIYINTETNRVVEVGAPIPPEVDRFSVKQIPGCVAVFPVRDNGTEMLWGVIPAEFRRRLEGGYVRIGKYEPDKPQQYSIQVLPSGPIADIEAGKLKISGYRKDGSVIVYYDEDKKVLPKTQWDYSSHDAKTYGSNILRDIFKSARFTYPKSVYAVMDCLKLVTAHKNDAIIVDFFAGSGTTLHATNLLNACDSGNRRCILVTNNELSADEEAAFRARGVLQGSEEWEAQGIAKNVTWPRTLYSILGTDATGNPLDGNYGVEIDTYEEDTDSIIISKQSGKPVKRKLYKKTKLQAYPELAKINKADGFGCNVKFFKCDWTPRKPEDYLLSNALCLHIREMIELQNAIEIDNVKNVLILNKSDFKKIILNPDIYAQIENIWVNQNIVLNSEELKLLEAKGFKYIPREFFGQELREAAE